MISTIGILQRAAELGLTLGIEEPKTLTFEPVDNCPPAFVDTLKDHKWVVLDLLRLPFVMVRSQALEGEILFFCEDEQTRAALVKAGAEELSIYIRDELQILSEQNRIAPLSLDELRKVHEIKKTLNARIRE